jgi:hypothetical protein
MPATSAIPGLRTKPGSGRCSAVQMTKPERLSLRSTLPRLLLYLLENWPSCVFIPRRYPRSERSRTSPYLNFGFAGAEKLKLQLALLTGGPKTEVELAYADFQFTPRSRHPTVRRGCPLSAKLRHKLPGGTGDLKGERKTPLEEDRSSGRG